MSATHHKRIISIDILRGIVMVIMALDHTRDFFSDFHHNPTDLQYAGTAMFFTRWITHFCAPVFVFLAGTSAYLSLRKCPTKGVTSRFLITRGIWLIILEMTVVRFGWQFNVDYTQVFVQVIWAIGWSMIFLAGLIWLPMPAILTIGLAMITGHNLLDPIHASRFGDDAIWWNLLHESDLTRIGGLNVMVIYPLIPWIGVMATGYCFGTIFRKEENARNKWLYGIGLSAIVAFILIRYINIYGDPTPWASQPTAWHTFLSFINCTKYPPSLLYLLMTIGPAIMALPVLEKMRNSAGRFFTVYGRVPMFYYILHIYLIHAMAIVVALLMNVPIADFMSNEHLFDPKPGWGFSLPWVYAYWLLTVAILYLPCRWFMNVKATHRKWWLSYV
ncbi:DUF1624 domain-containing protein [Polluticoccus soli]|uniref:DUF1624 domain-containing protein n=1 Tax=Polluticoccus soli TaxID=3034150 RepID=UPI0023E1CC97|nr:heparan-alpha-glucosaminide N-acetyltransferase domain-containing protein [Flavipsychrobacter sp. JY13-12]